MAASAEVMMLVRLRIPFNARKGHKRGGESQHRAGPAEFLSWFNSGAVASVRIFAVKLPKPHTLVKGAFEERKLRL